MSAAALNPNGATWRLLSYSVDGGAERPGLLVDGRVIDLGRGTQLDAASTMDILERWNALRATLDALAADVPATALALEDVRLHAPVSRPSGIFCTVSNYADHVAEMSAKTMVDKSSTFGPYMFMKSAHAIVGPDEDIARPMNSEALDWEVELGVIIGEGGKNISEEDAYKHIAGYVILNDVSARDL